MSESEDTVLGKRERDGLEETQGSNGKPDMVDDATEDSDDDIGPMPMPAGAPEVQAARKKRKGVFLEHLKPMES